MTRVRTRLGLALMTIAAMISAPACAQSAPNIIVDAAGTRHTFARPPQRIVSLAPHITELVFAAGAGDRLAGVVESSDYPDAALRLPRIGNSRQIDIERIAALKPDLVMVWSGGNAPRQLDRLTALQVPMFADDPITLADVARSLETFGRIFGTEPIARKAAADYRDQLARLIVRYENAAPVRVFYQVWQDPLMTIHGNHIISDVIRLCGGVNVFAAARTKVPVLAREAVVEADPDVIVASGGTKPDANEADPLAAWRKLARLRAVRLGNLMTIPGGTVSRLSPRVADGAQNMCDALDAARARLASDNKK